MTKKGILFVLSGPSGVGKGTVLGKLLEDYKDIHYSVSATTREARQDELDGRDYFFLSEEEFLQMCENDQFIEYARVHENYYGTPKSYVDECIKQGKDIILEIDIQGARQVRKQYPDAVFIFLVPPSLEELENRLDKRGSENKQDKNIRLKNAREEIKEKSKYDYKVVNDKIEKTVERLKEIIKAEKLKRKG